MGRIYAIAVNTFREAVRDRVLFGILAFASALLLFTLALAQLSLNQESRVVHDVGLSSISLSSVLVAIMLGSSLLYKEIERKTLYVILPKPIARYEFLIGKYLGITLTAFVFLAIMGAIQCWVEGIQMRGFDTLAAALPVVAVLPLVAIRSKWLDRTSLLLPWSLVVLAGCAAFAASRAVDVTTLWMSLVLFFGEVMVVAAIALLFSSFSTPFLTGVLTLGVWLLGRSADTMITIKSSVLNASSKALLRGVAEVIPNLNLFVPGRHLLQSSANAFGYVLTSMGYACGYAALLIALAAWIFRRRDFV